MTNPTSSNPLGTLTTDGRLLFLTRILRLFAYGGLSVVLLLYLVAVGLSSTQIGLLLTLTLVGDTLVSLWITTVADRLGRRRMLICGAVLMVFAGGLFALTDNIHLLLIAATLGIISPSGYEVGPFLSIEQASLAHIVPNERRTAVFAWYNLVGSCATAVGALVGGGLVQALQSRQISELGSYQSVVVGYALVGVVLGAVFTRLSSRVEVNTVDLRRGDTVTRRHGDWESAGTPCPRVSPSPRLGLKSTALRVEVAAGPGNAKLPSSGRGFLGLRGSQRMILKLSALFSLDAFAGGFVLQSIVAYWFHVRFGVQPATLGGIFFAANILAGLSALSAARVAARIGLIRTMVFTHLPSNVLLIFVPLMPNLSLAITILLIRFSISQMDVPARQSYIMAVVSPEERSAAAGVTGVARTLGAALAPIIAGPMLADAALMSVPFFVCGGLKIIYDLLLYRSFRTVRPPEEQARP
jgi:MFS family permease